MRRRLSSNIRWVRYLFLLIGIRLLLVLTNFLTADKIDFENILLVTIFLTVSGGIYYLFDKARTIEFDNDFMYVIGKSGEEKIPLEDVYKIEPTMYDLNDRNMWIIGYYNNCQIKKSVRIIPRGFHKHIKEFKNKVKFANKNVTF